LEGILSVKELSREPDGKATAARPWLRALA